MGEPATADARVGVAAVSAPVSAREASPRRSPVTTRVISDLIGAVDGVVAGLAGWASGIIYDAYVAHLSGGIERVEGLSLLGAIIFATLGFRAGAYNLNKLRRFTREGAALLVRWSLALLILVAVAFLLKIADSTSRGWLVSWYVSGCFLLLVARVAWRQTVRRLFRQSPALRRRVAIIGANDAAQRICAQLRRSDAGVEVVGIYDDRSGTSPPVTEIGPAGVVETIDTLISSCRSNPIDDVLITLPWTEEIKITHLVHRLRVLPCGVHLCPGVLGSRFAGGKLGMVGDAHVLEISRRSMEGWATIWKILQDRVLAGFGLLLLAPLLLIIAAAIKLETPGPVFFRQRRHGFNHHVFRIFKFRTMKVCEDGEKVVQATCNDYRITKVGAFLRRWSLDELPQLLNVVRGEMSLVGPRPHALAHDDEYEHLVEDYSARQRVLPGITGWAQVNGCRGETETPEQMRERVDFDHYYVENWSPLFDLKILALTLRAVIFDPTHHRQPTCVIVVENLPVPLDRRVWQEARALRDAGWRVSVISPATKDYPKREETIEGISVFRHPVPLEASGKIGFLAEYATALFHEFRLLFRIWWKTGIDVIQGCNPPDLIFLVAAPFKLLGARFVFDHHDVCPELFEVKFQRRGAFHRLLLICEWLTFRVADMVISTNETFRELAIARGGKDPARVKSVYSFPDRSRIQRVAASTKLRNGKKTVLGYVGIIGLQDGVDQLIHATNHLVRNRGINDIQTVIVGDGPAMDGLRTLAAELKLEDHITFTGYLREQSLIEALSTFDIAVIPDPSNAFNDKISMNKAFEYALLGIPAVAYRLRETMRMLGDAAVYVDGDGPDDLGDEILKLIVDEDLRSRLGRRALDRANCVFDWDREAEKYVAVFEHAISHKRRLARVPATVEVVF